SKASRIARVLVPLELVRRDLVEPHGAANAGRAARIPVSVRGRVEDGLDVVAVGIEDERRVVAAAVLGALTGRTVVRPAVADGRVVPACDGVGVRRDEGDVRAGGR